MTGNLGFLLLALKSKLPFGFEGELGIALESLQGKRDLI